jgi:hypothetical protein
MIKALKKLGKEGTYFNIIMAMYDKPISKMILNGGEPEITSSNVSNETVVASAGGTFSQSND